MDYFVLNEYSLKNSKNTLNYHNICDAFFKLYAQADKDGFNLIYVSNNVSDNWYEIPISVDFTIRDWLRTIDDYDYKSKLKKLIESTKQLPNKYFEFIDNELNEYTFKNLEVPILGLIYEQNQVSLSFCTTSYWDTNKLTLDVSTLDLENNLTMKQVDISNVSTLSHWNSISPKIKEEKFKLAKTVDEKMELLERLKLIRLTTKAQSQIRNIEPDFFFSVVSRLEYINNSIEDFQKNGKTLNYRNIITVCKDLSMSDESDTVKNNPRLSRLRTFNYNGVKIQCYYHIKNFKHNQRVHFCIYDEKIIIGYIGKHLANATDPG